MADSRYRKWSRRQLEQRPNFGVFITGRDNSVLADGLRLTPEILGVILRAAEDGDISAQSDLFTRLQADPHILAVMTARRLAICSRTFRLAPWDDTPLAKKAFELCEEQTDEVIDEVLFDLTDATGKGWSAAQNIWDLEGGRIVLRAIEWWPQQRFVLAPDNFEELRVLTAAQPTNGEELVPGQWTVHRQKAMSAALPTSPLFRTLAWRYLFKHYAERDWVIASEVYGTPRRFGKYPRGADQKEIEVIAKAAIDLGTDAAAVWPVGGEVGYVESQAGRGAMPFPALIRHCNDEISKAVLGQTMTTDAPERGARSLGEVQERVKDDITHADCIALARTIRRDILTPMVRYNLGESAPVPLCELAREEEDDLEARATVDEALVTKVKLPLGEDYFYAAYGRPKPTTSERVVGEATLVERESK